MSEIAFAKLDYVQSRTIWFLGLQLFYTLVAMIPVYYYLREIVQLSADARTLMIYLPIGIGILLYFMELRLNYYYWNAEKTFKRRDILTSSSKSALTVIFSYYFIYLFIFGYWLSDTKTYNRIKYQSDVGKLMGENIITLVIIYFFVIMLLSVQNSRLERSIKSRLRR